MNPTDLSTNKDLSYEVAEKRERLFVSMFGEKLGVKLNPFKEKDPTLPDLITQRSVFADLKNMWVPFFKAQEIYGIDPQYCWTFNVEDMIEYLQYHDNSFRIYIWVRFPYTKKYNITIRNMEAVYVTTLFHLKTACHHTRIHDYLRRKETDRHAKSSYGLDLTTATFYRVI